MKFISTKQGLGRGRISAYRATLESDVGSIAAVLVAIETDPFLAFLWRRVAVGYRLRNRSTYSRGGDGYKGQEVREVHDVVVRNIRLR